MKEITVTVTCDMPPEHAGDVVPDISFSLDGDNFETDLCGLHEGQLRAIVDGYVTFASSPRRKLPRTPRRTVRSRRRSAAIRKWAQEQGLPVSDKGRIAVGIVERYDREQRAGG